MRDIKFAKKIPGTNKIVVFGRQNSRQEKSDLIVFEFKIVESKLCLSICETYCNFQIDVSPESQFLIDNNNFYINWNLHGDFSNI